MKKKKYERLLKKAGRYAILSEYYGRLLDSPNTKNATDKIVYDCLWRYYTIQFAAIARRADVLDRVFG